MRQLLLGLALAVVARVADAQTLTPGERAALVASLTATQQQLLSAARQLTPAQWAFKPAPDRWSVAEVAEHLLLSDRALKGLVTEQLLTSAALGADRPAPRAAEVTAFMLDRSQRFQSPDNVRPSGQVQTQEQFAKAWTAERGALIKWIASTDAALHGHAFQHPAFGMMDGHDWLVFLATHTARHMLQAEEVMRHQAFP